MDVCLQMEIVAGIPLDERVYCPKPSCSTLFIVPEGTNGRAECASCGFDFCYRYRSTTSFGLPIIIYQLPATATLTPKHFLTLAMGVQKVQHF